MTSTVVTMRHLARDQTSRWTLSLLLLWPGVALVAEAIGIAPARVVLLLGAACALLPVVLISRAAPAAWRPLLVGLLAGVAATLAYDGARLLLAQLGLVNDPFRMITAYGSLFGSGVGDPTVVGWALHFWNGAAFGAFFVVALGRPRIWKGIVWGLFLELAQVATSPRLLQITIEGELLAASALGHLAYGLTLARTAQLLVRR